MRIRRQLRLAAAALAGAAVVVLPAQAASESTSGQAQITAENVGLSAHYWTPPSVRIEPGGSVVFSNPTSVPHGIRWTSSPGGHTPSCAESVPVGTTASASGPNWSGSCSFAAAGVYTFYCTVHGPAMSASVTVTAPTTTTGTTPTTTGPVAGGPVAGGGQPGAGGSPNPSGGGPSATGGLSALRLRPPRHGGTLRGSVDVPPADAGGRLEIDLFARAAALAAATPGVRVGLLVRQTVPAGVSSFAIAVDRRARAALRTHGRLALTVRVLLTPRHGAASSISSRVTLRR